MTTETQDRWYATGRRKTSIARVWMSPGTGQITINKREFDEYFTRATSRLVVLQPLELTDAVQRFDLKVNVNGGGMSGQAMAIKHGISRALEKMSPELRPTLKRAGYLTRDARVKERKKYGRRGARARFQFSKR
ncbi:MAG: 30S ribosomal protein S9 [bacterium]